MTPLYSKETAEDYVAAASGSNHIRLVSPSNEVKAINRLIENGNEVMELLVTMVHCGHDSRDGFAAIEDAYALIKKIKGEG